MDVFGLLLAELAGAIDRDIGHRARPVERHERDDVLEPVGPHLDQGLAHAGAFHLEHADRLAAAQHRVGLRIVERHGRRGRRAMPRRASSFDAGLEDRERLQAQEVELHQARPARPISC